MFRRHVLIGLSGTFLLFFSAFGCYAAAPALFLPSTAYEFSPVPSGVTVTRDIVVKNTGDAPLRIKGVRGQ